jgi:hypothetical protein
MARVFISHRSSDTREAERLSTELKGAGHDVRLDEWELNIGDSIVAWMNERISDANYVVLCYSSHGVMAPWIGREWMSTLARQLNGLPVKILPVRLTGGDPPSLLADVKYADMVADWARGLAELLRAMK